MGKRLVVCCDGTWNTPDQLSNGRPAPTNVTKLALAISPHDDAGIEQRTFYHSGVGTRSGEKLRGGAFGFGLSRDVRDAYRFLVAHFEPGDEIFFLGFSRGAFTARSTAGFVRNCGVLHPDEAGRVDEAYALYRSRTAHPRGVEAQLFRRSFSTETRIRFIGVWDTVGALGVPLSGARFLNFLNRGSQFHDTALSTTVDAAYQALAIDEKRKPFRPAVWTKQTSTVPQVVEQVWFAGVHCNVGGGYADHALSDIALLWMADRASHNGLAIDHNTLMAGPFAGNADDPGAPAPDPLGKLDKSRNGIYRVIPAWRRPIGAAVAGVESASSTAVERRDALSTYTPSNLTTYLAGDPHITTV